MKKIIIGVLALAVIGGIFVSTKIVKATDMDNPKMTIESTMGEVNILKNTEFEVEVLLNPGTIKYDSTNPEGTTRKLEDNILIVEKEVLLDMKSAKKVDILEGNVEKETNLGITGENIDLGTIVYEQKNHDYVAKPFSVILTFYTKETGIVKNLSENILLEYKNLKNQIGKASIAATSTIPINIGDMNYTMGKIDGIGINENTPENGSLYMDYGLNRDFTMKYRVNQGVLNAIDSEGNPINIDGLSKDSNRLIYTIDKAIIDEVGGNEETARDSLIKSLKDLKKKTPEIQTSLVILGEHAEIVEVNEKDIFDIDTLISEVENIEATEKAGNLGDGIRLSKYLANEFEGNSSIILVTGEEPNYYTQVSEGNTGMLYTRVNKEGITTENMKLADEYANKVVNDIVVNEEDNTRWYSINYGENKESVIYDLMEKLEGYSANVSKPYYDDFVLVNERAISPSIIRIEIEATSLASELIEINEKSKKQEIEFVFNEVNGKLESKAVEIDIIARLKKVDEENSMGIDVADPSNIKIEAKASSINVPSVIFNSSKNAEEGELVVWRVKPIIPYFVEYGLFNGRLKVELPKEPEKDITLEDIASMIEVEAIASQTLDELSEANLAIENSFGFGAIIKTKGEQGQKSNKINLVLRDHLTKQSILRIGQTGESLTTLKVYKYNKDTKEFADPQVISDQVNDVTFELDNNELYLVTIDHHIENAAFNGCRVGDVFEIGINIMDKGQSEALEDDFWGIKVNVVDKPEHF